MAASRTARRWLAAGLVVIGIGLALVALLGPLVTGVIDYRVTETLRNQTIGLDAVSLFVVAPLALFAAFLVSCGDIAGHALALGIGAYTAYMFAQYIVGPEYERLPGNNQLLFPLCVTLFAAGWLVVVEAWRTIDAERIALRRRTARRLRLIVLPALGFAAFARYLPALADTMSSSPSDKGYLAGPTFFWTIAMLDLGVFLPATVITCVGLARPTAWASKALYTIVGWFGLVGVAVASMAIAMYVNGDPNASGVSAIFMTMLGLSFAALAVYLLRPLVHLQPLSRLTHASGQH